MYCTQQVIRGENFHDQLKNRENRESFPTRKFCHMRYVFTDWSLLTNCLSGKAAEIANSCVITTKYIKYINSIHSMSNFFYHVCC